ncbi:MAG: carboxypeptidase-like regulatory domain-containing protein [Planctomycetes bacterium]|nr:carboxypeptidase-like regulatory domain-containing protein [Planctomycetota bacterium]
MGRNRMRLWGRVSAVLIAIAVAVLLPFGGRGGARASPEDSGPIVGQVIDEATKKPIAGALVSLWQRDRSLPSAEEELAGDIALDLDWPTKSVRSVRTEARGDFAFPAVAGPGAAWLTVSATGYSAVVTRIGKGVFASVALVATPLAKVRFVRTTPAGLAPAAGAEVFLLPAGIGQPPSQRFTADADGRVAIPIAERTEVVVRAPGCAIMRRTWNSGLAKGDLELETGAPLAGVVRAPSGQPVARAVVQARYGAMSLRAESDAAGRFRFDVIPVRVRGLELEVKAPGCARRVVDAFAGDLDMQVVVGPDARVSGRVIDEMGKPVAGANVWLAYPAAEQDVTIMGATSEADGSFRTDAVPPGFWVLKSKLPSGSVASRLVHIAPGAAMEAIDLRPRNRTVSLAIRVVDERRGDPVPHVRARAVQRSDLLGRPTDAEGRVALEVTASDEGDTEVFLSGGPLGAGTLAARIPRADLLRGKVDVALTSPATLRLSVLDPDGKVVPPDGVFRGVQLDAADVALAFDPAVELGGMGCVVTVPSVHPFRVAVWSPAAAAVWRGVLRYGDAKNGTLELRLRRLLVARGRCTLPKGANLRGISVGAERLQRDELAGALGQAIGTVSGSEFEILLPAPGRWRMVIALDDDARRSVLAFREIDVAESGVTDVGDLGDLTPVTVLRGVVRASGRPVPGAAVAADVGAGELSVTASNIDGSWELCVPRGTAGTVSAVRAGYGVVGRPFGPDSTAPIDLTMSIGCAVILRNAVDSVNRAADVEIRSAGFVRKLRAHPGCGELEVEMLAPGPVEIVVGDDLTGRRTVRAEAVPGRVVEVDLATAK